MALFSTKPMLTAFALRNYYFFQDKHLKICKKLSKNVKNRSRSSFLTGVFAEYTGLQVNLTFN
jgi:hypothetical protein